MASTVTKKRLQTTSRRHTARTRPARRVGDMTLDELSAFVQTLIERKLAEKRALTAARDQPPSTARWAQLVALARRAEGNWRESEGRGTSIEIVRRLREDWQPVS